MIRGLVTWLVTVLVVGCMVPLPAEAQPTPPATFSGSASIDGKPAPSGTAIRAFIGGHDCTQPGAAGTVLQGGVALYRIEVLAESQLAGCGSEGRVVTFSIAGLSANQTATWIAAVQTLDLTASTATPQRGATPTSVAATPTAPVVATVPASVTTPWTGTPASPSPLALVGSGSPESGVLNSDSPATDRPIGRTRSPIVTALGLAVVGVVVGAGAIWWSRRRSDRREERPD